MQRFLLVIMPVAILLSRCGSPTPEVSGEGPLFELLDEDASGVTFENPIHEDAGHHAGLYDYLYNGGGVAIGDVNNDDRPDLYFTGNFTGNKLYLNTGKLKFDDVTQKAGVSGDRWATGVCFVDINQDGWQDIYVCNSGPPWQESSRANQLFVNQGDGTFIDEAPQRGINNNGNSTQASFFDYDKDGDLDLFVMNHISMFISAKHEIYRRLGSMSPAEFNTHCNALYRNRGDGTFEDISDAAGVRMPGYGLGLAISDFDKNGWLDVYIANDFFIPDFYLINLGNGTFSDQVKARTGHISYYSMGCDAADINNDGWVDLGIVDMTPGDHKRNKILMASMDVGSFHTLTKELNFQRQYMFNTLQLNRGGGFFSEIGNMAGVAQTDWSWAALIADFDNDGWKDYFVTNGYWRDTKNNDYRVKLASIREENDGKLPPERFFEEMQKVPQVPTPNFIYRNRGDLTFEDVSEHWGMTSPTFSNGAAYGDLDADGDLDLVVSNIGSNAHVYRNLAMENGGSNYLQVTLQSNNPVQAFHAKITIQTTDGDQFQEFATVRGYQSAMDPVVHFGLGETQRIDTLRVDWLDGTTTIVPNPGINKRLAVQKSNVPVPTQPEKRRPFYDLTSRLVVDPFIHQENTYNDFATEVLLPHGQSRLGPAIAVGDVNGDGTADFYIGGAMGQAGKLYLQQDNGVFATADQQPWVAHRHHEDTGARFFDADGDGDPDLYVASGGGGDMSGRNSLLQDRLYQNDGSGQFRHVDNLPSTTTSSGRVVPADFDADGDLDLFVCGRTAPGKYPSPGRSYLLQNERGAFRDVTEAMAPDLAEAGMVTDAIWEDLNADGKPDLMVIGEWMPIVIFENTGSALQRRSSSSLKDTQGWWYSIEGADFDGDGDRDFIVGNVGLNNKFHPATEKPLHIYANDYDDNGTLDIVLSKVYQGHLVPVRGKECSTEQMPFVSDKFPTYTAFANATLEEIYTETKLSTAIHYEARTFASVFLENKGQFDFAIHALPAEAQLGPVKGIVIHDFDEDGAPEVVLAGAIFEAEVETPSYDANIGLYLDVEEGLVFKPLPIALESGIFLNRNVKDLALLTVGPNRNAGILVANNDSQMQIFVHN